MVAVVEMAAVEAVTRIHLNDVINFDSRDSMLVPSCYVGIKGRLYGECIHACRFSRLRWSL